MTLSMSAWYPLGQELQRFFDSLRRIAQALPLGIFPELPQHLGDQILHPGIVPQGVGRPGLAACVRGVGAGPGRRCAVRNRVLLADAVKAAAIWQARIDHDPKDFEAAWKRSRAGYWIGGHETDQPARDRAYD